TDIYNALKNARQKNYDEVDVWVDYDSNDLIESDWVTVEDTATWSDADTSASLSNESTSSEPYTTLPVSSGDYSNTNLRDQKVDEADIVKTDGKNLYIIQKDQYLTIVKADKENSEVLSRTALYASSDSDPEVPFLLQGGDSLTSQSIEELFISGDHLILLVRESVNDPGHWNDKYFTRIVTLDISDLSCPSVLGNISQDGSYSQARRIGDTTYLYTTKTVYVEDKKKDTDLAVTIGDQELSPKSFCIPNVVTSQDYLIFSAISDADPSDITDAGVFVSGADNFYISENSLYVLNSYYENSNSNSQISRISLEDGTFHGIASCVLSGYINNTWSVDEYQGNLRVLITYNTRDLAKFLSSLLTGNSLSYSLSRSQGSRMNALLILDAHLQTVSKLVGIGKNEEIKSARFMGDTAYFVTYQNTDPLFCADLSDPKNPTLLGELEITGFSSYLHPFGADRLLGIGYETDPVSGRTKGLKFTMFDTSDPGNLKPVHTYVLNGVTSCPAINNYKSIFISPEKNLFGFYYDDRYLLYAYDESDGFSNAGIYDLLIAGYSGLSSPSTVRGLYIGDEFYLAGPSYVTGFSLSGDSDREFALDTFPET
ncbi:MAG: beta-propeller domain-containing protein, partial [Eubacteriales bacterium]|nr:beta-propeller domain-containing protein [Eubacteriales bacterium]